MNNIFKNIGKNRIPKHVAIIMDGNGRWAKKWISEAIVIKKALILLELPSRHQ